MCLSPNRIKPPRRRLRRRWMPADRRGGVAAMVGFAAPVMIGFLGLAIDTTYWETNKINLQGAADQAAVSAGRAYRSENDVTLEAVAVLANHGIKNGVADTTVAVSQPPATGSFAGNPQAIEVKVTQPQKSIFTAALGITPPTLTTRAVTAPAYAGGGACIIALATTGTAIAMNGTNTVDISLCNVYNNSTSASGTTLVGGAYLSALNAYLVGDWSGGGTFAVSRTLQRGASPVADPYATRAMPAVPSRCNATKAAHSSSASYVAAADGKFVFCEGLKLTGSGNTLTLGPGIYMFDRDQFSINGDWTINATNATLMFTSSTGSDHAELKVNGNQTVNITPPTTGVSKGVAVWMHRNAAASKSINFGGGSTLNIVGAIYGANADVTVSGSNGSAACTQVVARTITFNGNNTFRHECTGVGISDPPGSLPALVLVQ